MAPEPSSVRSMQAAMENFKRPFLRLCLRKSDRTAVLIRVRRADLELTLSGRVLVPTASKAGLEADHIPPLE